MRLKTLFILSLLILLIYVLVYGVNENAKRDEFYFPTTIQESRTSGEIRRVKCREDGVQLFQIIDSTATTTPLLASSSNNFEITVSSTNVSYLATDTSRLQILINNIGLENIYISFISGTYPNEVGFILPSGASYIEDKWQGEIYLQAEKGVSPQEVRIAVLRK